MCQKTTQKEKLHLISELGLSFIKKGGYEREICVAYAILAKKDLWEYGFIKKNLLVDKFVSSVLDIYQKHGWHISFLPWEQQ